MKKFLVNNMLNNKKIYGYFTTHYPHLGSVKNVRLLPHNNINSMNYLVISSKGQYVLRNFTDNSKPQKIETICKILNQCIKKNVTVFNPIKNTAGKYVDDGNRIYLTQYYAGSLYDGSSDQLQDLAKELALLHRALKKISILYNYNTNRSYYRSVEIDELKQIEDKIKSQTNQDFLDKLVIKNLECLKSWILYDEEKSKELKKLHLKKQLIHHDLHPGNSIFFKNKVVAIIDFNSMRKGVKIEDVAFTSFRFASFKNSNISRIKQLMQLFVDSYMNYNSIGTNEIKMFEFLLTHKILGKISYILRKKYMNNSNSWSKDFQKNVEFLRLLEGQKLL
ncbi:MAG: phosphotransferase [Thaumarchaeota archaeon]|nr:phosphotransferase [Nitrososphaerota archaeon]